MVKSGVYIVVSSSLNWIFKPLIRSVNYNLPLTLDLDDNCQLL